MAQRQRSDPGSVAPLQSAYAGDPEMAELVGMFVRELPVRLEAFVGAWRAGDREALCRMAHQLRGSGAGYGFPALSRAAADLESALRGLDGSAAGAATEAIQSKVEALLAVCRRAAVR